jgi:hypothetical protein
VELGAGNEAEQLSRAVAHHAKAETPYGTVVQGIELETFDGPMKWDIINPFAYIWYLSSLSQDFAVLIADSLRRSQNMLRLVMYGDELTPGNPLRSDGGRQAFNFYYSFLDFPHWLLHRKDGWLCFGSLKTTSVDVLVGGVAGLMTTIMKMLFCDGYANFSSGFTFCINGGYRVCRAAFAGFIADEKGLKEFYDIKGQGGVKPCIDCKNVVNFIHKKSVTAARGDGYIVGLDVQSITDLDLHTDASIYAMVDDLIEKRIAAAPDFSNLEMLYGINYNERSPLFTRELRNILKPKTHYNRDWQHTLASSGVAGTQLAACLTAVKKDATLKRASIDFETIETYCMQFNLPSSQGKINGNWFRSKFLAEDHVKHFASDVLAMVPLLTSFLEQIVAPLGVLGEHIKCMQLLNRILSLLQYTYAVSDEWHADLRKTVNDHHALFINLYHKHIKVKFHHLLHLPDDLHMLGVVISCFVTERKHRDWKRFSLYAFRNTEHASTVDFVNYSVQEFCSGRFKFTESFLIDAEKVYIEDHPYDMSWVAFLTAGEARRNDVVAIDERNSIKVGKVIQFVGDGPEIFAKVEFYTEVRGSKSEYRTDRSSIEYVPCNAVRAKCAWAKMRPDVILVLLPRVLY